MTINDFKIIYAQISRWALPFLLLLLLFLVFTCGHQNNENADLQTRLNASLDRTKQLENQKGQLVAQNSVIFTSDQKQLKALTDSVFSLKDREGRLIKAVESYTQIIQSVNFKGKSAAFDDRPHVNEKGDTVFLEQPADPNLVRVPRPFSYSDSSISFAGKVRKTDVLIDSLKIPNVLSLRTVETKTGLFKRTTQVQAVNSNPAFVNSKIATIQVKHKPTAWNRWIKPALFAGAGVFIGKQLK